MPRATKTAVIATQSTLNGTGAGMPSKSTSPAIANTSENTSMPRAATT